MPIAHYEKVDLQHVVAEFSEDKEHRISLTIPFLERCNQNTLCIIGQNPSAANESHADPTLRYFEKYVYHNLPQYDRIVMLNLYSKMDTKKEYKKDIERPETTKALCKHIEKHTNFLLAYGAAKKVGAYNFHKKITELWPLLCKKNVFKIDIGTHTNYPPHPGNQKIFYSNCDYPLTAFELFF